MKHELKPVDGPLNPEVETVLNQYPKGKGGYILQLFKVFANSFRFLSGKGVVNLLDDGSPLSPIERELVILRVTANNDCEYEWGVHVSAFANAVGLSDEQATKTRTGTASDSIWTKRQALLLQCVDDICQHALILDDNYAQFQSVWTCEQQLEILALCGNYHTVSFVANTVRLPMEKMAKAFPS